MFSCVWLLTHFLTFRPGREGQLRNYVDAIQMGQRPLDAAKAAFGDLKTLDRELNIYMRGKLTGIEIAARRLPPEPVRLRSLTPGEAAVMKVRIRSKRGVDDKSARVVAPQARKIAANFPADAFVQASLAEAEYDAGDYTAAEAAADRALALKPNDIQALIFKGRAQLALAAANPATANWPAVRRWFFRANQVDTEMPRH